MPVVSRQARIAWDSHEFSNGNRTELSAHTAWLWQRVDCQPPAANGPTIARTLASESLRSLACTPGYYASMASSTAICRACAHPRERSLLLAGPGHACAARLHVGLKLLVIAPWLICMHRQRFRMSFPASLHPLPCPWMRLRVVIETAIWMAAQERGAFRPHAPRARWPAT